MESVSIRPVSTDGHNEESGSSLRDGFQLVTPVLVLGNGLQKGFISVPEFFIVFLSYVLSDR